MLCSDIQGPVLPVGIGDAGTKDTVVQVSNLSVYHPDRTGIAFCRRETQELLSQHVCVAFTSKICILACQEGGMCSTKAMKAVSPPDVHVLNPLVCTRVHK